ncbi:hypothetical protein GCM10007170_03550 [Arthrobacter liuii]|uniref:Uncharacterized protein n=1 Tax=Arthrobacter liuii TaxID=1476996 RepID=A0ABQ2AHS3_9MICC|nr:hypothetical protein GCM10007170_03550 [Arthrobacter liuii]
MRPALLAGAAAATWLTLSSTAAAADIGPDSSSLPGSATSSVSTLTQNLPDTVSPAPAASPAAPAAAPGLLQPQVTQVSGLADNLIATVPVVDPVVPAGTVSYVAAPLAEAFDGVTAGVAEAVVTPATEAVPVLEPALRPVDDLLTGTAPLPVLPADAVQAELPAMATAAPADSQPAAREATTDAVEPAPEPDRAAPQLTSAGTGSYDPSLAPAGASALAGTAAHGPAVPVLNDPASEQPLPVDPAPLPAQAPAAPGSDTGGGGSSGGSPGAAAWLSPFDFGFERPGAVAAGDTSEHAPAPVSFDPGSSPD